MDGNDVSRYELMLCLEDTDAAVQRSSEWLEKFPRSYSIKTMHESILKRQRVLREECIKHGYAEYINGEFRLKEKGE